MVGEWDGWLAKNHMISSLFPLQQSSLKSPSRVSEFSNAEERCRAILVWMLLAVFFLGLQLWWNIWVPFWVSWMAMDKQWMPAMRIYHHLPELDIFRSLSSRIFPAINIKFYRICRPAMFDSVWWHHTPDIWSPARWWDFFGQDYPRALRSH